VKETLLLLGFESSEDGLASWECLQLDHDESDLKCRYVHVLWVCWGACRRVGKLRRWSAHHKVCMDEIMWSR